MSIFHQEEAQPGWQLCRQDLTPEELKDNETLTYDADTITFALSAIEGFTDSSAIFLYIAIIIHILFVDTLKSKSTYLIIQLQISSMLMFGHMTQMAGFMISPCRVFPMKNETLFENVCLGLATAQFFTFIAAFSWKFLDHICIHFTITKEFQNKLNNLEQQNQSNVNKRSVSIPNNSISVGNGRTQFSSMDDNSNDNPRKLSQEERFKMRRFDSTVSIGGGKIKRTFSKDLFTVDRGNLRARVDERRRQKRKEMMIQEKNKQLQAQKKRSESIKSKAIDDGVKDRGSFFKEYYNKWYIRTFCKIETPNIWKLLLLGYLPALILTAGAFTTKFFVAPIMRPDNVTFLNNTYFNHTNVVDIIYWSSIKGVDVYCSPGTKTLYMWFLFPYVLLASAASFLLKIKSHQTFDLYQKMTVGDFEGNEQSCSLKPSPRSRGMSTISQFVKLRPLKQFSNLLNEQFQPLSAQMRAASLLLLLMFIYAAVTCLATVSWWGMAFPFAAISFLQATMFFNLIIVKRKYSDKMKSLVDKYCGCGIVETDDKDNTDEDEDWIL